MDARFLRYYNRELQHLREMGGEFAREFPKIAGRLGLEEFDCADPYVERLLEGFAFLTARVQMKQDAEFPRFTQSMLETVCPNYLAPVPSMVIAQFTPNYGEGALTDGFVIERGSRMRSRLGADEQTGCVYTTAHPVTLFPLKLTAADYYTRELASLALPSSVRARAGIRISLESTRGMAMNSLSMDELTFFLQGGDEFPMRLMEQLFAHLQQVAVLDGESGECLELLDSSVLSRVGFGEDEAMLPYDERNFQGYRLLQEYFALPQRFMFFKLARLLDSVKRAGGNRLDLVLLLDEEDLELEGRVNAEHFALFCTPAVNLFHKRCDRILLGERKVEHQVIPDRTRPLDYEVYAIEKVTGYGETADIKQDFKPFYGAGDLDVGRDEAHAYYSMNRAPRVYSTRERRTGGRSSYQGSEVFLTLADATTPPYDLAIKQLGLQCLCTNRDLPLHIPLGIGDSDFTLEDNAPITALKCAKGPTPPHPSYAEGEMVWRLISQLSPNYLSLVEDRDGDGNCLQDLLRLYVDPNDAPTLHQVRGVVSVSNRSVVRRIDRPGPIAFARGLEIELTFDEDHFQGIGVFLLGMVLESFFAKYVSINCLTETIVKSTQRGILKVWPARIGTRSLM